MNSNFWRPPVDIYRTQKGWFIKFDLAGIHPDDVRIEIRANRLSISGARRDFMSQEGIFYHSMEITYSHFERTIILPFVPEPSSINWDYQNGMLVVQVQTSRREDRP